MKVFVKADVLRYRGKDILKGTEIELPEDLATANLELGTVELEVEKKKPVEEVEKKKPVEEVEKKKVVKTPKASNKKPEKKKAK